MCIEPYVMATLLWKASILCAFIRVFVSALTKLEGYVIFLLGFNTSFSDFIHVFITMKTCAPLTGIYV